MCVLAPISRAVLSSTVALLLTLSATACGSDVDDAAAPAEIATSTAAPATSTTVAPITAAPTTTIGPLTSFPTPREAGAALFAAWTADARQLVVAVAPAAELDKLFAAAPGPDAKDRGCDDGAFGSASCFFGNGQGGVNVSLSPGPAGGWVVSAIDPFG